MFILNKNIISEMFISYEKRKCEQAESVLCIAQFIEQGKVKHLFKSGVEMG